MASVEELHASFRPERITTLLIGEPAPHGGTSASESVQAASRYAPAQATQSSNHLSATQLVREVLGDTVKRIIMVALACIVFLISGIWLRNELMIDSCHDNGGRWISETGQCDGRN